MSQNFPDIEIPEPTFSLERFRKEYQGTNGRLELNLNAETYIADDPQQISYFRKFLKDYLESLSFERTRPTKLNLLLRSINLFIERHLMEQPNIFPRPQIQNFSIDPEVKEIMETDECSRMIINSVLLDLQETPELENENYHISVSFEQDIEIPEWKEIVVSVGIEKREYDERMRLWEIIEERIEAKTETIRTKNPMKAEMIETIYENLAIEIEEIF